MVSHITGCVVAPEIMDIVDVNVSVLQLRRWAQIIIFLFVLVQYHHQCASSLGLLLCLFSFFFNVFFFSLSVL